MDFSAARRHMVESQIRTSRVVDEAVIAAMADVPRERFVPGRLQPVAYIDEDLKISDGRYLMEPAVLARLLQEANVEPSDVVLDIGSGSGYGAAILARLAGTVFALESDPLLSARASQLFTELGLDNVVPVDGPLAEGCPKHAPYNVILIEGAVETIPDVVVDQLEDGGRLVAVVQERGVGRATVVRRVGDHLSRRVVFDAAIPVLPEFRTPAGFVF